MPLNEIAKKKMTQYLNEMIENSENEDFTKLTAKGSLISSVGEIFDDDTEWASELFLAGMITAVLQVYLTDKDFSDEVKSEISTILKRYYTDAISAISTDDWLKFHKTFRNSLWDMNKLSK